MRQGMRIRQAQVALWQAMKREHAAHEDQDADIWEALKCCPAVQEYERNTTRSKEGE